MVKEKQFINVSRITQDKHEIINKAVDKINNMLMWKNLFTFRSNKRADIRKLLENLIKNKTNLEDLFNGTSGYIIYQEKTKKKDTYIFHMTRKCMKNNLGLYYNIFNYNRIEKLFTIVFEYDRNKNIIYTHYKIINRRLGIINYSTSIFNPLFIPYIISTYIKDIKNNTKVVFKKKEIKLNSDSNEIDFTVAPLRNETESLVAKIFTIKLINSSISKTKLDPFNGEFDGDVMLMSRLDRYLVYIKKK